MMAKLDRQVKYKFNLVLPRTIGLQEVALSQRETDCLWHLVQNKTAKQTAQILRLSSRTVEGHLRSAKIKLGCFKKRGLIEFLIKNDFIEQAQKAQSCLKRKDGNMDKNKKKLLENLLKAVEKNDSQLVTKCLQAGADPNGYEDYYKLRPLHVAVNNNAYESAALLLDAGANLFSQTIAGETPMDYLTLKKDSRLIILLLTIRDQIFLNPIKAK